MLNRNIIHTICILCVTILAVSCGTQKNSNISYGGAFENKVHAAKTDNATICTDKNAENAIRKTEENNSKEIPEYAAKRTIKNAIHNYRYLKKLNTPEKIQETKKIVQQFKNSPQKANSSGGGGGGIALIGILLLLFLLFRKVFGLSAGWSWGLVIFLLTFILVFIWLNDVD